jgi:Bacterial Ig domain
MKTLPMALLLPFLALLILLVPGTTTRLRAQDGGLAPRVSITWPVEGDFFGFDTLIRLRADVAEGDHPIAYVRFYADTNLIASATNPPFSAMWWVTLKSVTSPTLRLKAAAVDTAGASATSSLVEITAMVGPPQTP